MDNKEILNTAGVTTIAAAAGALASVFFTRWIDQFSFSISSILIILYTIFIFFVIYFLLPYIYKIK